MQPWADPIGDVRKILSDGPTDKLCYRKQVIGQQDGTNLTFKTFEARRVSPFVSATAPIGVYLDNQTVTVASEDLESGEFTLTSGAPTDGQALRATYYSQWFTDAEITQFLVSAAEFIGQADNYTSIGEDLRPAAKEYAAGTAYQKLSAKFAQNLAETFQLYDAPDQKRFDPVQAYMKISESKIKLAFKLRDDVYAGRKGQSGAPISGVVQGRVRNVAPNR